MSLFYRVDPTNSIRYARPDPHFIRFDLHHSCYNLHSLVRSCWRWKKIISVSLNRQHRHLKLRSTDLSPISASFIQQSPIKISSSLIRNHCTWLRADSNIPARAPAVLQAISTCNRAHNSPCSTTSDASAECWTVEWPMQTPAAGPVKVCPLI